MQWNGSANKMWELAHFVAVTRPGYSSPDGVKLPEGKVDTLEIPALAISSTDVRRRAEHGEPVWSSRTRWRGAIHRQAWSVFIRGLTIRTRTSVHLYEGW